MDLSNADGATTVIVVLMSFVLLGSAAFSVDTGSLWSARRQLITASDAASLAGIRDFASGGNGCATTDDTFVEANAPGATSTCSYTTSSSGGTITVTATKTVETTFAAAAFGIANRTMSSTSYARWGSPPSATGFRPFAVCVTANAELVNWLASPDHSPTIIRIYYAHDPDGTAPCGNAPGNTGQLDFNGGANGTSEQVEWIVNGYDGVLGVGDPSLSCTDEPQVCIDGNPGALSNNVDTGLGALKASGDVFPVPLFDELTNSGANGQFHIVGAASVRLVDYDLTGTANSRYLDFEFQFGVAPGQCCGSGINTGLVVVGLCSEEYGSC